MRKVIMGCAVVALVALCPKYEAITGQMEDATTLASHASMVAVPRAEAGVASWYGQEFQDSETASGEPFDLEGLTAAHRELPLGTRIKVTNVANLHSVVLRVNDRGPNVAGRLIDVSLAAAQRLGFEGLGKTRVNIKVESFPRGYVAPGVTPPSLSASCLRPAP
jgi:rare lipoprotein A